MQFRLVIFCFFFLLPILAQPDTSPTLLPSSPTDPKAANLGPALPPDLTIEIPLLVGSLEQAQQHMDGICHELEGKLTQWEQQVRKYHEEVKQLEQQLRRVGQKWKQAENNKEKERYHQEFQLKTTAALDGLLDAVAYEAIAAADDEDEASLANPKLID